MVSVNARVSVRVKAKVKIMITVRVKASFTFLMQGLCVASGQGLRVMATVGDKPRVRVRVQGYGQAFQNC